MTKNEKRLQKEIKRAAKAANKYIKTMTKVDKAMRKLPIDLSLAYMLEKNYFQKMPPVLSSTVYLQSGSEAILEMLKPVEPGDILDD